LESDPVAERGPKGSRRREAACRFESCRAYWRAIQWRSEARRDRDAGKQPAGSSPAGRIEKHWETIAFRI